MNYSKPEVVKLANSIEAIQNSLKQELDVVDSPTSRTSITAYQADE